MLYLLKLREFQSEFSVKDYENPTDLILRIGYRLLQQLDPKYTYHCKAHTLAVMGFIDDLFKWNDALGAYDKKRIYVTGYQYRALKIAAMFHDLGYLDSPVHNEGIGVAYAMAAMASLSETQGEFADTIKNDVANYILSTARLKVPVDRRQAIILDADMVHVGASDPDEFLKWNKRLRDEYEALGKVYTHKEWLYTQTAFLSKVKFRTAFAKEKGMDKNLKANIRALKDFYNLKKAQK